MRARSHGADAASSGAGEYAETRPDAGRRRTLLLLAIDDDARDPTPSDAILLASLDLDRGKVSVLHVPLDLYVEVPGVGWRTLGAVYGLGERREPRQPAGGVGLLIGTLRYNLGIEEIDGFGLVELSAFVNVVDTLHRIDIRVPARIARTRRGPTEELETMVSEAGEQHMDGARALAYVRLGHPGDASAGVEQQRQVLHAIQRKARTPLFLSQLPAVLDAAKASVRTDLDVAEQIELARWVGALHDGDIEHYAIVGPRTTVANPGESVITARWERVDPLLKRVFGPRAGHP